MEIEARVLCPLSLPQTHCIVVVSPGIGRLQFRKTAKALDDLIRLLRRTVVGLGKKEIAARIGGAEISRSEKGLHRLVIVAARIKGDAETDRHARRIRIALRRLPEELNRRLKRPMQKKLAGPVEEIALARVLMSGNFKFIRCRDELAVFLFDLPQQVVQFGRVLLL